MLSEMIQCDLIDWPEHDSKERSRNKGEFVKSLAKSIEIEGLHQAIVLRPNAAKPGRFLGVCGWHRYHAVAKILKRDAIEAKVILDMDDTDAEMASIAENLYRNPLTKAQRYIAIRKWFEHHEAKYPHKSRAMANQPVKPRKSEVALVDDVRLTRGLTDADPVGGAPYEPIAPNDEPAVVTNFPELLSQTTGESLASAKVTTKIARTFNADQIEIFEQMQVGRVDRHTIAKIPDQTKRDEVVNLVLAGMEVREAIVRVTQPEGGKLKLGNGKVVEVPIEAPAPADGERAEADLTDAEWLEEYCGAFRKILPDVARAKYDIDAAAYRAVREARNAFKARVKKAVKAFPGGLKGAFVRSLNRILNVAHPKHWLLCGACQGLGVERGGKCLACFGDGYIARMEGK